MRDVPQPKSFDADQLAVGILRNDTAAIEIFSRVYGVRFRNIFAACGFWDAEAMAISTVSDIVLKIKKYRRDIGSFNSWCNRFARNRMLDAMKSETRRLVRERRHADENGSNGEPGEIDEARAEAIRVGLTRLRTQDRDILMLQYYCGLDDKEIAQWYDIEPGAVRTRLTRARQRLGEVLETNPVIMAHRNQRTHK